MTILYMMIDDLTIKKENTVPISRVLFRKKRCLSFI